MKAITDKQADDKTGTKPVFGLSPVLAGLGKIVQPFGADLYIYFFEQPGTYNE